MQREPLLERIDAYVKRTRIPVTRFGREAVRDPNLVFDLRAGRRLGRRLEARITAWLDAREGGAGGQS